MRTLVNTDNESQTLMYLQPHFTDSGSQRTVYFLAIIRHRKLTVQIILDFLELTQFCCLKTKGSTIKRFNKVLPLATHVSLPWLFAAVIFVTLLSLCLLQSSINHVFVAYFLRGRLIRTLLYVLLVFMSLLTGVYCPFLPEKLTRLFLLKEVKIAHDCRE